MANETAFNDLINEGVIELPVNSNITIIQARDVEIFLMLTNRYACLSTWEELKLE